MIKKVEIKEFEKNTRISEIHTFQGLMNVFLKMICEVIKFLLSLSVNCGAQVLEPACREAGFSRTLVHLFSRSLGIGHDRMRGY